MWNKREVDLIFVAKTKNAKGTPIELETIKKVRCDEMGAWSVNYYSNQNRRMQLSNNLRVDESQVDDYLHEEKVYQLKYVKFNGRKYQIKNILIDKKLRRKKILDIEEVNINEKVI